MRDGSKHENRGRVREEGAEFGRLGGKEKDGSPEMGRKSASATEVHMSI